MKWNSSIQANKARCQNSLSLQPDEDFFPGNRLLCVSGNVNQTPTSFLQCTEAPKPTTPQPHSPLTHEPLNHVGSEKNVITATVSRFSTSTNHYINIEKSFTTKNCGVLFSGFWCFFQWSSLRKLVPLYKALLQCLREWNAKRHVARLLWSYSRLHVLPSFTFDSISIRGNLPSYNVCGVRNEECGYDVGLFTVHTRYMHLMYYGHQLGLHCSTNLCHIVKMASRNNFALFKKQRISAKSHDIWDYTKVDKGISVDLYHLIYKTSLPLFGTCCSSATFTKHPHDNHNSVRSRYCLILSAAL
ncbi:unnamed protein product [Brugia pahangi]|uniref:Metalloendopeptidase n=1 Tax=Brugia pahangi TaxID=6280 RepID=A0A0N4TN70_BRUPA|nr:unnamed protein product [Brugia pahangi]